MKMFSISLAISLAAFAQQPNIAAKPADGGAKTVSAPAPQLPSTAKLWRLLAEAQQAQTAATEAAKTAKEAQDALTAEQQRLSGLCGSEFVLAVDQNPKSDSYKDVVCQVKPKEQPPAGK